MSYKLRVFALLGLFFALTVGSSVVLVMASREFASDELHVGEGKSNFPPQVLTPEAKP